MDKNNKKIIVIIVIIVIVIISIIAIYQNLIKREDYLEISSNTNILNTYEENNQTEDNLLSKENIENTENKIKIYITGAIKNTGVYELKENSRIADCIEKAGGITNEADLSNINLAYILEDGVKIYIPKKGENINNINDNTQEFVTKENGKQESSKNSKTTQNSKSSSSLSSENKISKNEKVNINTASQTDLETLPGIGSSTALKIIEYRKSKGKFNSIEDIKKVNGIGESKFTKIKDLIKI